MLVGLYGGRFIFVNEEDDLFYFDIFVLLKKFCLDCVLYFRLVNIINEELMDCLISLVFMVYGVDFFKGVCCLVVLGWVLKLIDGGCLGWYF